MTLLHDRLSSAVATTPLSDGPLLDVRNLMTEFKTPGGWLRAVNDVSFPVQRGKVLGILSVNQGLGRAPCCARCSVCSRVRRLSVVRC